MTQDEKFEFFQDKYGHKFQYFDSLTASTSNQAFKQLDDDKCGTLNQIITSNMIQSSIKQGLLPDAKYFLITQLFLIKEKYGEEAFVQWYNNKAVLRFWLSKFCRNQFFSNRSEFYRLHFQTDKITHVESFEDEENTYQLYEQPDDNIDPELELNELYNKFLRVLQKLRNEDKITNTHYNHFLIYINAKIHSPEKPKLRFVDIARQNKINEKSFATSISKVKKQIKKLFLDFEFNSNLLE